MNTTDELENGGGNVEAVEEVATELTANVGKPAAKPLSKALVAAAEARARKKAEQEAILAAREARTQIDEEVADSIAVKGKPETANKITTPCPNHPDREAVLYGVCMECYEKLPKIKKRELYLKARLAGVNAHNYPAAAVKAWRQELVFIASGIWQGPMKIKSKNKLVGEIIG